MARPGRPASENYRPVCFSGGQSVSYSSEAGIVGLEDEDDQAPIFSLSKSAMDVVMATGPARRRDPAWTRMDLRRSSSTNTHSERNSVTLQQLHPPVWQHISATSSHRLSPTAQNVDVQSPPAVSERWIANMQRWSERDGNTHSRSSTPETAAWTSRPSSLIQETPCSAAPDSATSKPTSPPTTHSPFISPLQTPDQTRSLQELLSLSSSRLTLSAHDQHEDLLASSPTPPPLLSPLQTPTSSPLPSNSPDLLRLTSTEDEGFLENNLLSFTFPSPIPSSVSLVDGGVSSDHECPVDDVKEELLSPRGTQLSQGGGETSQVQTFSCQTSNSPAEGRISGTRASIFHLELPWELGQSCQTGRGWSSHLVSSLSDSHLGDCCKCNLNTREGFAEAPKVGVFRTQGTMTSQLELVDAAVQTTSPIGSLWGLRRNTSTSNMGSHSILGSPPGSRLNLKSSVGSNSNLVSPSSSMFPVSSGEEEYRQGDDLTTWDVNSDFSALERRRSCLKIQGEGKDELGRRSSMKQVQWDEDGMTWDIHGASVDPEVLCTAIQKQLELRKSPQPQQKRTSKKKKAPKPPVIPNVVKAIAPELNPPVMIITSACMVEGESEEKPEPEEGRKVEEEGGGTKEETVGVARRISRAEGDKSKEEEEVYGEEGSSHPKAPSRGSEHSRKKSVIRALRRPRWCGGSRKADD